MRRISLGLVGSGVVLFGSGALGVMGSWAMVASVLLLTGGALLLAIAMEEVDPAPVRHLTVVTPGSTPTNVVDLRP